MSSSQEHQVHSATRSSLKNSTCVGAPITAAIAAFGPAVVFFNSVDIIGGHVGNGLFWMAIFESAIQLAIWAACAAATIANRKDARTAKMLLRSSLAVTGTSAVGTLAGLFVLVGLFTTFAACLALSMSVLALAAWNAKSAKD